MRKGSENAPAPAFKKFNWSLKSVRYGKSWFSSANRLEWTKTAVNRLLQFGLLRLFRKYESLLIPLTSQLPLDISCPVYLERIRGASISNDAQMETEADRLADVFTDRMDQNLPNYVEVVNSDYLDIYATKHVEKWVEKVGLHFIRYSQSPSTPALAGSRIPSTLVHLRRQRRRRAPARRLTQKVFSGDVSGSIGEALFALLLTQHYGIPSKNITHLRGTSQTGPSPDFYIRSIPNRLASDLSPFSPSTVISPLFCEVKGATGTQFSTLSEKLRDAFDQVESLRTPPRYGMTGIFLRDALRKTFHGLLTVIQP